MAKRDGRDRQYCWQNYLSSATLSMMEDMRFQFLDLLSDIGFYDHSRGLQVDKPSSAATFYGKHNPHSRAHAC